jgi:hypothetical protein
MVEREGWKGVLGTADGSWRAVTIGHNRSRATLWHLAGLDHKGDIEDAGL